MATVFPKIAKALMDQRIVVPKHVDLHKLQADLLKAFNLRDYRCGYCSFDGFVSETSDYTRCPSCGAL